MGDAQVQLISHIAAIFDRDDKTRNSTLLMGAAGCGKSHIMIGLRDKLGSIYSIRLVGTTGVSAIHIGGVTMHSQLGIPVDANLTHDMLYGKIMQKAGLRELWMTPNLVVAIDEMSMLSAELFDILDSVGRAVRNAPGLPWGGIRLLLCGDFMQLPPIGGRMLFESETFKKMFYPVPGAYSMSCEAFDIVENVIILKHNYRHGPEMLAIMKELRLGQISDATHAFLNSLSRPLPPYEGIEPTNLFSTNMDVDFKNTDALAKIESESRNFVAIDKGSTSVYGKGMLVPATLTLKVGAQVMCLKNMPDNKIFNGSRGVVVGFEDDGREAGSSNSPIPILYPLVKYMSGQIVRMEPMLFEIVKDGKRLFSRRQVPLKLAWAITIHKSQSLTIDRLVIDLRGTSRNFGQAYVAVSRGTSFDNIQLVGYDKNCFKTSPDVIAFLARFNIA
jgi:hypothetical protein